MHRLPEQRPDRNPERRQWFVFGIWRFDVTRAQQIIAERPRTTTRIAVGSWAHAYGLHQLDRTGSVSLLGPGPDFDPAHAMTTNLSVPVILATISHQTEPVLLLIDGTHRLYKAHTHHYDTLPAFVLDPAETLTIRTTR